MAKSCAGPSIAPIKYFAFSSLVEDEVSNSIHQRFKPEDLFYNVPQPIPQPWYQPYLYYLIPTYSPEIGSNEEPAAYDY